MWDYTEITGSLAKAIGSAAFWLAVATAAFASASASTSAAGTNGASAEPGVMRVYVGTYTSGGGAEKSEGIYLFDLDVQSGTLGPKRLACKAVDPSFLAIHPSGRFLYAVSERGEVDGKPAGAVLGFSIDQATGELNEINQESSRGAGPCHLIVDPSGKNVLVANYGSGSVACLPIDGEGKLAPATSFIQHAGKGTDPGRQEGPHAHSINLDTTGRFAVAADLGLDKVFVYKFDALKGSLSPNEPQFAKVAQGSGPRHFAFSRDGKFGYVISEMANTITGFTFDAENGSLREVDTISTLPENFRGKSFTAEVQFHPKRNFLYGSNRGHDSIAVFAVEPETGKLNLVQIEPTQGKNPRNFAIDPTGTFLLAENGDSGTIVVFNIDPESGKLVPTGQSIRVPKPVCIKMIPKPAGATR